MRMNSWQEPGNYQEAGFLSHNSEPYEPVGADGCDKLSFEPSLKPASGPARRGLADGAERHAAPPPAQRTNRRQRPGHLAPEEGGRQAAAGGRGQPGRGERPRLLQRGAVRLPQRRPGELPERLQGRHGRSRHPAARRPAQGLDLPRPAERQPVRQPAGRLHGGLGARGDGQDRRQDRHRPEHGPGHRHLRRKPAAAVQRLQAGLLRRPRRYAGQPERLRHLHRHQHLRPRGRAAP